MEHYYVGNNFVAVVENLIAEGGKWFGDKIVWAGDYADPEVDDNGEVITSTWTDDQTGKVTPYDVTLYDIVRDNIIKPEVTKRPRYRYLVNMDTKEFVDMKHLTVDHVWESEKGKKFPIYLHPLPLLTCEGCEGGARGGGDFRGNDPNCLVGKWSRNRITISTKKPKGCTELIFDLVE
jgi:hypothetical protein